MNGLIQDLRYAIRAFARNPGFTAAAVLSLAHRRRRQHRDLQRRQRAAAAAAAVPGRRPAGASSGTDRRAWASPKTGSRPRSTSTSRTGISGFEQVAIAIGGNYNLTGDGEPERIGTIRVSSNLLPMLGARAVARPAVRRRRGRRRAAPASPSSATARGCGATAATPRSSAARSRSTASPSRSSACCRRRSRCRAR